MSELKGHLSDYMDEKMEEIFRRTRGNLHEEEGSLTDESNENHSLETTE